MKCFDHALDIDPIFVKALLAKGFVLFKLKLHKQADECYNKVLEIDPDNKVALESKKNLFIWKKRMVVNWIVAPIYIMMLIALLYVLYALYLSCL